MRLIALAYFAHFLRHGMIFPLIPLFAKEMEASGALIGAAVSAFSLLSLVAAVPLGRLTDRIGARSLLLASASFNCLYSLLLLAAEGIPGLVAAQMLGGLGFLLLIVSSQSWVSRHADKGIRERGFGFLSLAAAAGQSLGPFFGGMLLSRTSFPIVFTAALGLSLIGFCVAGLREEGRGGSPETGRQTPRLGEALRRFAADRGMLAVLVFSFAAVFAVSLRNSFVPVLFKERGLQEGAIGLLLSAFALSMTLVRTVIGRIMGRVARRHLLALALGLILLGTAALPAVRHAWATAGIMLLFGAGFGISQPLSMVMVSDRAGEAFSGLAMGIRFTVITLATLLSPAVSGLIVDCAGLETAFYSVAALVVAAALLIRLVFGPGSEPQKRGGP
jgi:MFS family permease